MIRALLIGLIRLYQKALSPLLGPRCRFAPSCSNYAIAVIETHGPFGGALLSLIRLCKCHPFHPGGYDPPPPSPPRPLRPRSRVGLGRQAAADTQRALETTGRGETKHSNLPLIAEKAAAP